MTKKQNDTPMIPKPVSKPISEFTEVELKAAAYDLIEQQQRIHQQLQVINQELQKRQKPVK